MSDTTQEKPRWQFRAFHETPEHLAARLTAVDPNATPTTPPEPITIARQQLALAVRQDGFVIDLDSVRVCTREPVVVNDAMDDYRHARPDEAPSGHLTLWTCTGHERVGTDADDPILYVTRDDNLGAWVATVPEPQASVGGSCRIRHERNANVTVMAHQPDGEGIGYLFATTLDADTVHIEFFGGTATFRITED